MENDPGSTKQNPLMIDSPLLEAKVKEEIEEKFVHAETSNTINGLIETNNSPWGRIRNPHSIPSTVFEQIEDNNELPISSRLRSKHRSASNTSPAPVDRNSTLKKRRTYTYRLPHIGVAYSDGISASPIAISGDHESVATRVRKLSKEVAIPISRKRCITNLSNLLQCSTLTPFLNKNGIISCFYCNTEFASMENLREHVSKYKDFEIEFGVSKCQFNDNFLVYVDISDLRCKICTKSIPNLSKLQSHLNTVHKKKINNIDRIVPYKMPPQIYNCQMCDMSFTTFSAIEDHMNVHFNYLRCNMCEKGFPTRGKLRLHVRSVHPKFTCQTCFQVFYDRYEFSKHASKAHKNIMPFVRMIKCDLCPKEFTEKSEVQKHIDEEHDGHKYKCDRVKLPILDTLSIKLFTTNSGVKTKKTIKLRKILPRKNAIKIDMASAKK